MATRVVELLAAANAFSKIRRSLLQLCFVRQRLADQVPNEATNDDVFPKFGNLRIQQVANCHIGIFYEALLEQANRFQKKSKAHRVLSFKNMLRGGCITTSA